MASLISNPTQLTERLFASIPNETADAVRRIVETGASRGAVYAVGGTVRDLLLARPLVDVDIATEGDAIDIVRSAVPDALMMAHAAFRTASVEAGGLWIDVATARRETYPAPGALPSVVTPANIEQDLTRRDFTVSAMALRLDENAPLLAPGGGLADLDARIIRVLHDASFHDDATRIFRAFRYAARLQFTIEEPTRELLIRDIGFVKTISGERLRRELELLVREPNGGEALQGAADAAALFAIHPALSWDERQTRALAAPPTPGLPLVPFGFSLVAANADAAQADEIVERLRLSRDEAAAVRGVAAMRQMEATLRRPEAKPSGVAVMLDRVPPASVAAFTATTDDAIAGALALRYLEDWRGVKPILSGKDIIDMGVPEGPRVQQGLQLLRAARLDGWASDRDDERALVLRFAKSIGDASAARSPIDLKFNVN